MVSVLVMFAGTVRDLFEMPAARPVLAKRERKERPTSDGMEKCMAIELKFAEKAGGVRPRFG